ncbi:MAG TPA: amidohydrolase family protein [Solirubrobacterales bacterium]|nr:amidohydrolase family protein [Solirubrobacterales bacterium]
MDAVDVHQHLLGEPLIEALARRSAAPRLIARREGWTFRLAGEPDSILALAATDAELRRADLEADGIDRALVALSTALGIESLPGEEATALIDAHHAGLEELPVEFGGWGAVPLGEPEPDPAAVDAALGRGCVGVTLPATALADPAGVERLGPLLARLAERDAPLFVHPGPVCIYPRSEGVNADTASARLPHWWPALTDYVAQMQAAWFAFLHAGRPAHRRLRVLFAMLAGGAPLHLERYAARRGVPAPGPDPLVFYDTSSYGPRMIGAMAAAVGGDQLVYGSDRPVVEPPVIDRDRAWPDPDLRQALLAANPARLLSHESNHDPKGALA